MNFQVNFLKIKRMICGIFFVNICFNLFALNINKRINSNLNDIVQPTVTVVFPSANEKISLTEPIVFKFSRQVNNVNSSSVKLIKNSDSSIVVLSIAKLDDVKYTATFTGSLSNNSKYTLSFTENITDNAGIALVPYYFKFTTGDFTIPTVNMIDPINNSVNISLKPNIQLQFSKSVLNVNDTNIILRQGSEAGPMVPIGNITVGANNSYTFNPNHNLSGLTVYYVIADVGITDLSGNALIKTVFKFTTGDFTVPTVNMIDPINNSTIKLLLPIIQLQFSESVVNVNTTNIILRQGNETGPLVPINNIKAEANNIFKLQTEQLNPQNTYYVIAESGISDLSGNALVKSIFNFKTDSQSSLFICTWMSGANYTNQNGVYGIKGIADINNIPGARAAAISWGDKLGNIWLFGGYDHPASNSLFNDLWKYDVEADMWTWVNGANYTNQDGIYGSKGVPNINNTPGARQGGMGWVDNAGNLWLFGGMFGLDYINNPAFFNDLWKYDINTNRWTWMSGSNTIDQAGIYGSKGVPNINNAPGGRFNGTFWYDNKSTNIWLFGGGGIDMFAIAAGNLSDLWKYDINTNTWTWISGYNTIEQPGAYSPKGVSNISNIPGSRDSASPWVDTLGNLWLFGGHGHSDNYQIGTLADVWEYNINTNIWTWRSGVLTRDNSGVYGIRKLPDVTNMIGGRTISASTFDVQNDFWLFGGVDTSSNFYNDLWECKFYGPTVQYFGASAK